MLCNKDCYNEIWTQLIYPMIEEYIIIDWIQMKENAKESIWECYENFNQHCRNEYMISGNKKLDRHKVAACYMCAILKADPLLITKTPASADTKIVATEQLAISVGLSILKAFLISEYDTDDEKKPEEVWKNEYEIFKDDFVFPCKDEVCHGAYRNNFAMELYFTKTENKYNILSLSHSLYLLEMYNRQHWKILQYK